MTMIAGTSIDQLNATPLELAAPRRRGHYLRLMRDNPLGTMGLIVIIMLVLVGTFGPGLTVKVPAGGPTIVETPRLTAYSYRELQTGERFENPSLAHPFGTDKLGHDMFSRVVAGARISLLVGFISVLGGVSLGMLIGISSGYFGGWLDNATQRVVDTIIAFPGLVLLLIIVSVLEPSIWTVILVIGAVTAVPTSRVVRGATLSERTNQYIEAARALGASAPRILFRHLLPNILPLGIVLATTSLGAAILAESGLSFLALGIPPPNPSWGNDINAGRVPPFHIWWPLFPGVAISLTVLAFNLLGDSLRDIADPRLRGSRKA